MSNNQTMYMYFNGSNGDVAWTHFQNMDNDSEEAYTDENENGQVNVDISFRMTPELTKRIYIEADGLIRGSFKINVQGDWTNDNDGNTACGQNDCDELNITLMAGPNIIGEHHETGLVQGDNTVVFNFQMEEDTVVDWNKKDFNPVVKVEMKLQGNYQDAGTLELLQLENLQVFQCKWVWTVSLNYQSMKPHGKRVSKTAANSALRWKTHLDSHWSLHRLPLQWRSLSTSARKKKPKRDSAHCLNRCC